MPLGVVVLGEDAIIHSGATATPADPVSHIESYSRPVNRPLTTRAVFMAAAAISFPGAREVTLTLTGLLSLGDTGQNNLRTAEANGTPVYVKLWPDGLAGIIAPYRVASRGLDAAADGPTEVSFDLGLDGAEVGSGI
ncbi:MAG: hypothetical protein H0V43_07180 [Gemmatimonadales bacterium]|nr:hypothetical protein [Gemmatimonadales bacterium]